MQQINLFQNIHFAYFGGFSQIFFHKPKYMAFANGFKKKNEKFLNFVPYIYGKF
jgi:hypothetical protein